MSCMLHEIQEVEGLERGMVGFWTSCTEVLLAWWFQCVIFRPEASALPGNTVEMQILGSLPKIYSIINSGE